MERLAFAASQHGPAGEIILSAMAKAKSASADPVSCESATHGRGCCPLVVRGGHVHQEGHSKWERHSRVLSGSSEPKAALMLLLLRRGLQHRNTLPGQV